MAETRICDVQLQIWYYGSTLKSEFKYFRNLDEVPMDLKSEYLRIMQRAYMRNSSGIRPHMAQNYRKVIGILVAASWIHLPSDIKQTVKFYHATVQEFITGDPIGKKQDKNWARADDSGGELET
ncbi:uncharacterized protein EI90DRAFT_3117967 [Cantharellus anzutake]|uniref:uncharacterized protein n=1 Tax=Cantharellus anzutake TaxID=1750568 RepID=UPI0019044A68|nr:uncharacterized protein EI90DRAFT_3117967 [Cantharellus anzutake]KAF8338898.1 hypothetical protein EI90DRAFT_3117967 [Cantharellus anzutake]